MRPTLTIALLALALCCGLRAGWADPPPPSVGVVRVVKKPMRETSEFVGRIEATDRVNLVARVTAFLEEIDFTEGTEVHKGDLLYRLEQPPFEADVAAKAAQVTQYQAQLENARITRRRAELLLHTPAGQQSTLDDARANELALEAELMQAEASLRLSRINLGYTEIRAPIDGRIGRTNVTVGNVVSPSSGTLATIVSQDPMYVLFPVSLREVLGLRRRYADQGGLERVVLRLKLPDGRIYGETGRLDFVDNTVSQNTDTLLLRGVVPNPPLGGEGGRGGRGRMVSRELTDGEFVTVILEGVQPVEALTVPRAAVLTDMAGDYVYVVGPGNRIEQRRIVLGQTTPADAAVIRGLGEGELVVLEGLQKVRPGQVVSPGPATPPPAPDRAAAAGPVHAE